MKKYIPSLILPVLMSVMATQVAKGAEICASDSVTNLQEVVVQGDSRYTNAKKTTYLPTGQQKKAAFDGTQLLQFLGIPQLKISPVDKTVSSVDGQEVKMFINGVQASDMEIKAMQTEDVIRVEILTNPEDPRYQGAAYAVNYVICVYEYGGYTRLQETGTLFAEFINNAYIYSKFSYKRMMFDLSVNSQDVSAKHSGTNQSQTYLLTRDDKPFTVNRSLRFTGGQFIYHTLPVNFRALYQDDSKYISNSVSFNFNGIPRSNSTGILEMSTPLETFTDTYHNIAQKYDRDFQWTGNYYFYLSKDYTLNLFSTFNYGNHRLAKHYFTDNGMSETIINNAKSDVFSGSISASLSKRFNKFHTLKANLLGNINYTRAKYSGNSNFMSRIRTYMGIYSLDYYYNYNNRFSADFHASLIHQRTTSGGIVNNSLTPSFTINISYSPNSKMRFYLHIPYEYFTPSSADYTDGVIRQSEYIYVKGNPLIKHGKIFNPTFNWAWFPSNYFSISYNFAYSGNFNRYLTTYTPYNNGEAILQTYTNNGNFHYISSGASIDTYLLNQSLNLSVGGGIVHYSSTGDLQRKLTVGVFGASASYVVGPFNFSAYCNLGGKSMSQYDGSIVHTRVRYGFSAGWGSSHWKVSMNIRNPFEKGYLYSTTELNYLIYKSISETYNATYHHPLSISVAYIFDYGKKIQHGNEVSGAGTTGSGILQ
ncbi:MAG: hypothetical protein NC186_04900 [Prevotella sp.]|nr:hypothetical protein [Prevotella sp.]